MTSFRLQGRPTRWSDTRRFLYYLVPIFNLFLVMGALILGAVACQ